MVSVGKVVHGLELLVDDTDASFVCATGDFLNVLGRFAHIFQLMVNVFRGLDGSLRVELGWAFQSGPSQVSSSASLTRVRNLEKHILHYVASIWSLELKLLALEEYVVKTPDRCGEHGRHTLLAILNFHN